MSVNVFKHSERHQEVDIEERQARAEAAAWMVRLYGDDRTPELECALREWLQAHPRNARHFEEMTQVWELGGEISAHGLPRLTSNSESHSGWRWRSAAVAAGIIFLTLLGGWFGYREWAEARYSTGLGEQRLIRLQDGSRVILNSGTRLRVELTDEMRHVYLDAGEALFEVAQDKARPFTVTAGTHEVTALGTSFVVRYDVGRTAITLVEGKVRISDDSGSASTSEVPGKSRYAVAVLAPGERMTFIAKEPPKVDTPRIESVTAWQRGEVLFDNTSLGEAVMEMNRYDTRQLVIDDPNLASLRISGVYRTGDSAGFARGLADLHGLAVRQEGERIHLGR